ncbi:hypothetical protein [Sphingomonas sp.]|uniref:hypothetical protein n=1 Tax=Sphingomonas sp. TaxID=28214 RepID=UPI0025FFC1B2|nr:hypothetical protein [Sphingomonas sp.]
MAFLILGHFRMTNFAFGPGDARQGLKGFLAYNPLAASVVAWSGGLLKVDGSKLPAKISSDLGV